MTLPHSYKVFDLQQSNIKPYEKIQTTLLVTLKVQHRVLREIARGQGEVGSEWRARWKASKDTGTPLFKYVVAEWNPSQVALAYWFSFYDSVYEHPDRPPQKVIENDDLLDKWVEDQAKKMEDLAKKNDNSKYHTRNALDYDEVIIFEDADEPYQEELEEYSDNGIDVRFEGVDYYE